MSVIPDRKDYKNVDRAAVGDFVAALSKKGYEQVSHIPPTEKSHFERFGLVKNARRVVIVFDVKAKMVSITAFGDQFKEICSEFEKSRSYAKNNKTALSPDDDSAAKAVPGQEKKQLKISYGDNNKPYAGDKNGAAQKPTSTDDKNGAAQKSASTGDMANQDARTANTAVKAQNNRKIPTKKSGAPQKNQNAAKSDNKITPERSERRANIPPKQADTKPENRTENRQKADARTPSAKPEQCKNDFALKKYTAERFDAAISSLKDNKIKLKLKSNQGSGASRVDIYEVSSGKSKLTVCYMPEKKILQIQGKATDFSRKVQTLFSESVDYKSAVKAHIEQKQTDERAATVEKRLKKYLPVGCMYLSPQAKIDFSIGIVDLLSGNIVLSDYSSLLIPPYRGLEKLIFDLEQSQGIKVKMIGQAYEKNDDGEYCLKAIYRRRIGSVVFAEVMAALYTEYNSTRNFYVHSAAGTQTKVINDKNQAIAIYEKMLSVVEYNAKKLREIGFTLKQ